jgi:pimeloyl-ACP methyl ester carboxylesterase
MEQDFKFYQKRENCKNLILFVHGFTGSDSTWYNTNGNSFPQLLLDNSYIAKNFDVVTYEYFTALLDLFAASKEKYRFVKNLIKGVTHKKEKNLEIQELASNLSNHLRFTLEQYDHIYVVAHSMGGLMTKALI